MKDTVIKTLQKFLNGIFTYDQLLIFLDQQKDFLLKDYVIDNTERSEYNALWDTVLYLQRYLSYADKPNTLIACEINVLQLFDNNLKDRLT